MPKKSIKKWLGLNDKGLLKAVKTNSFKTAAAAEGMTVSEYKDYIQRKKTKKDYNPNKGATFK
jgi:hypothetical protein